MSQGGATHVILLTPAGRGAVASMLITGPSATGAMARLFHPVNRGPLDTQTQDAILLGHWGDRDAAETVVVSRRAAEQWEIHCHGGAAASAQIVADLVENGCCPLPAEDWLTNFEPGGMAGQASLALTRATTERAAAILLDQHGGALERALAGIVAQIDAGDDRLAGETLDELLAAAPLGLHLTEPWRVVLAGRPNAGKSSLVNRLVGYERAIVYDQPGTTRDVVTATTALGGWPVHLADTAGLRRGGDPIERQGIARTKDQMTRSDLILLICDRSAAWTDEDRALLADWPAALLVLSKCDLPPHPTAPALAARCTSAVTGEGIAELIDDMTHRLVPNRPPPGAAVPFLAIHVEGIQQARQALAAGQPAAAAKWLRTLLGNEDC